MDPTEYQFLKQQYSNQQDANGFSDGNNLMDSLDISRELTASSGSLVSDFIYLLYAPEKGRQIQYGFEHTKVVCINVQ